MHNFDFKKYLTENKLTSNSKLLSEIRSGRAERNNYLVIVREFDQDDDVYEYGKIGEVIKVKIDIPLEDYLSEEVRDEIEFTDFEVSAKGTVGILYGYDVTVYYINTAAYLRQAREIEASWDTRDTDSVIEQVSAVLRLNDLG
jgi:hypothetical protein